MAIASKSKTRGSAKRKEKFDPAGKVVVVGNLKGGCGKSTIAFNLAVWLATVLYGMGALVLALLGGQKGLPLVMQVADRPRPTPPPPLNGFSP